MRTLVALGTAGLMLASAGCGAGRDRPLTAEERHLCALSARPTVSVADREAVRAEAEHGLVRHFIPPRAVNTGIYSAIVDLATSEQPRREILFGSSSKGAHLVAGPSVPAAQARLTKACDKAKA